MSKFFRLKKFINSKDDEAIIYRTNIIDHCGYFGSMDNYLQALDTLGYLSHIGNNRFMSLIGHDSYVKIKDIPKNVSATTVSDIYRNRRFYFKSLRWFNIKIKNKT